MVEFGQGWEGWGRKDTEGAIGVLASACSVMLPSRPWGLAQAAATATRSPTRLLPVHSLPRFHLRPLNPPKVLDSDSYSRSPRSAAVGTGPTMPL